jgi:uncharacterized protein (UPF0332 family)
MNSLIAKARQSLRSAHALLEIGDPSGAANRAYYAIFDGMRACIQHFANIDLKAVKTHHGVFRLFEKHVLAPGLIAPDEARIVYRAQELRWSGDYAIFIELDTTQVTQALAAAEEFVETCAGLVETGEKQS